MPPTPLPPACWYRLASPAPTGAGGAIAIVQVGGDVQRVLAALGVRPVSIGAAALREVGGIDTLVVARMAEDAALLFPHAGPAVVAKLIAALERAGAVRADEVDAPELYPEAAGEVEARMLAALARARSPLAIDLLLDQPRRWAEAEGDPSRMLPGGACRVLNRLIDPPLVAALGAPNIGKSSLVNALAGRGVAIVADVPGTTRDHVGVMLDLAGLVVRYLDTPGIHEGAEGIDARAQARALEAVGGADLVLMCADGGADYLQPPGPPADVLRVGLRSDLGPPVAGADVLVSVRNGTGLRELTAAIRARLAPDELRADPRAWRFW